MPLHDIKVNNVHFNLVQRNKVNVQSFELICSPAVKSQYALTLNPL